MKKISKLILVSLILLMALIGSAGATSFYVDVVDGISGNYISGASVYFTTTHYGGSTTNSNMYGRATFSSAYTVVGDHYVAQASKSGYTTGTTEAYSMLQAVYDGYPIIVFIYPVTPSPTPTPSSLSELGLVLSNEAGTAGIGGASVTLSGPGVTTSTKTTLSDGMQSWTGTFTVGQTYRLDVSASGYVTQYWNVLITQTMLNNGVIYEYMNTGSMTPTPTPTPVPSATVTFNIKNATGDNLPGAWVVVRDNTNALIGANASNSGTGSYIQFFQPIPSSYSINVSKTGYDSYTHTYSSAPTDGQSYTINLNATIIETGSTGTPTLHLKMDGSNGGTTFTDEESHTVTPTSVTTSTSIYRVGTASAYFGQTSNELSIPDSSDWILNNGDFTFHAHVYFTTLSGDQGILSQYASGSQNFGIYWGTNNKLYLYGTGAGEGYHYASWTPSTNTWYQVVIEKSSSTCLMYIDGTPLSVTANIEFSGNGDIAAPLEIGKYYGGASYFTGYMDEVKLWKGSVIPIANLTPPLSPTPTPTPYISPTPTTTGGIYDQAPYYNVDVVDGITGNYISGATVHFQTTHFTRTLGATYSAGRATFNSPNTIVGDTYLAEAEKSGYNSGPPNYYTTSMHQDTITSNIYNYGTPLIVYLYPVAPEPTPTPSSLSDIVIQILGEDLVTGLSGASVTLSGPGVTTSTKITLSDGTQGWTGNFQLGEIYRITVSSLGYNTQYWDVVLTQTILNNGIIYEYMDVQSILASCVINVNIVSASTAYLIQGANFGIYDPIHDVWNNATTNNGLGYFDATGGDNEYPLSIGENVTIAAWADGYRYNSQQVIIADQESEFWLNLLPTGELPSAGNYTIVFTVLSNTNQHPLKDVTITSGLGAIKLTNDAGTATFIDVPIGANHNFQFTKTGYQSSTLSVNGGDGEVIMKIVELVPIGVTATPTPTFVVNPGISNQSQDLNVKGQTFLIQWADMAIGTGSLVFLLLILYFARKLLE